MTALDRTESRRYLEMLYHTKLRPLIGRVPEAVNQPCQNGDSHVTEALDEPLQNGDGPHTP